MIHQLCKETMVGKIFYVPLDGAKRIQILEEKEDNLFLCNFLDDELENMVFKKDDLFSIQEKCFCEKCWETNTESFITFHKEDLIPLRSTNFFLFYKRPKLGPKGLSRFPKVNISYIRGGYIYWNEIAGFHFLKEGTEADYCNLVEKFKENLDCMYQTDETKAVYKNMYYIPEENRYAEWDYVRLKKGGY